MGKYSTVEESLSIKVNNIMKSRKCTTNMKTMSETIPRTFSNINANSVVK
jgi:hypothetical protein